MSEKLKAEQDKKSGGVGAFMEKLWSHPDAGLHSSFISAMENLLTAVHQAGPGTDTWPEGYAAGNEVTLVAVDPREGTMVSYQYQLSTPGQFLRDYQAFLDGTFVPEMNLDELCSAVSSRGISMSPYVEGRTKISKEDFRRVVTEFLTVMAEEGLALESGMGSVSAEVDSVHHSGQAIMVWPRKNMHTSVVLTVGATQDDMRRAIQELQRRSDMGDTDWVRSAT